MRTFVKTRFKKFLSAFVLLFIVLFVCRLIYGYKTVPDQQLPEVFNETIEFQTVETVSIGRKNYATKKWEQVGQSLTSVDQKYEKVADITALSTQFEDEEKLIRKQIKKYNGLIQFENKSGNHGHRKLNLTIGIPPESFDLIYTDLVKIGIILSKQITKTDKTNEYKELNARKSSLEKIRRSLVDLKSKGGRIDEYMQLENRILEIEHQLQELGVSLGNFDDENEFCTVKIMLSESSLTTIGMLQRLKVAFEWTVKNYLFLMIGLSFMTLFTYLLLLSIEKIRTNFK